MMSTKRKAALIERQELAHQTMADKWLFFCAADQSVSTLTLEHSSWPRTYTLSDKLSLTKHTMHTLIDAKTGKSFDAELIEVGDADIVAKAEAKGTHKLAQCSQRGSDGL